MNAKVNSIKGYEDAIKGMYISKHSLTREMENEIDFVVRAATTYNGSVNNEADEECLDKFNRWLSSLVKWGKNHITLLRYIDISVSVYGLHRGGQDDWDAHAKRFDNRILRNSSRIGGIKDESHLQNMSDYYKDKVLTTDAALKVLGIDLPTEIEYDGELYVRAFNGYIVKGLENNPDVKRGLYNLGFPSDFIFKCNLTEFAHIYKERNAKSSANPEVKLCCEQIVDCIESMQSLFNRELLEGIRN